MSEYRLDTYILNETCSYSDIRIADFFPKTHVQLKIEIVH